MYIYRERECVYVVASIFFFKNKTKLHSWSIFSTKKKRKKKKKERVQGKRRLKKRTSRCYGYGYGKEEKLT